MSDVFVSYKAEDRAKVQPLVDALQADGLSVWWDAHIGGADDWREVIARELDGARCVIVAWSKRSTGSEGHFVRDEATRALRRGAYLAVCIDKVDPPLGFGESQAISLNGWKGDRSDARYQAVLSAAQRVAAGKQNVPQPLVVHQTHISRRALIVGGAATATAASVGGWLLLNSTSADASDSIAVLPFANLSGDPAKAYFSDGMAEELRNALARIAQLKVVGRTSSEMVRDTDAIVAAKKLRVANILTGSVRQSPATIRISAQLVNGETGMEQWSHNYDRGPGDVLQIQTSIAESVAGALSIHFGRAERAALTIGGSTNAAARDLYLKADAIRRSSDGAPAQRRALALVEAALELDHRYAAGHALHSVQLRSLASQYADSPDESRLGLEQAGQAARRAIGLAPQFAPGYSALGRAQLDQLDFRRSFDQYRKAYSLASGDVEILSTFASALSWTGKREHSLTLADQAQTLDPLNPTSLMVKADCLLYARRYGEAADLSRRALAMAPDRTNSLLILGFSLLLLGRKKESLAALNKLPPGDWKRLYSLALLRARMGDRVAADRALADFTAIDNGIFGIQFAEIRAQRNEIDQAFAALNQAWVTRDPGLSTIRVDPFLDPLRSDPRFATLVRKLKLP